jgi:hypothetical protein
MAAALTLDDVGAAVKVGDAAVVAAGLAQCGGESTLAIGGVKEDWFARACGYGHTKVVTLLLSLNGERAVTVHAKSLYCACEGGHVEVIKLLLGLTGERAINVHAENEAAFCWACRGGHSEVVALLLGLTGERAVNVHAGNEWAFRCACSHGRIEVIKLLLGLGGARAIDVRTQNAVFRWACRYGRTETVTLLLSRRNCGGAPAVKTLRQGGEWGYRVKQQDALEKQWHALAEQPRWLAAARRAGAMAARATRRCRRCS